MSGTINLALSQQFDMDGRPLSGGLLYFYQAATSATPQDSFQDPALTIKNPNPLHLDASGRVPMFYVADGNIKIRLTDKNGVTIIAQDNLLVIGPSGGSAPPSSSTDPTKLFDTGDIRSRFGNETAIAGWVRCNGNSIGPTGSGASELAGSAALALFLHLWPFTSIAVLPSKGTGAQADWDAGNKTLVLPDLRGRSLAGVDGMGNIVGNANRLTAQWWGGGNPGGTGGPGTPSNVVGNAGGTEDYTLFDQNVPQHKHSGTTDNEQTKHTHSWGPTFTGDNPSTPVLNSDIFTTGSPLTTDVSHVAKSLDHTHKAGTHFAGSYAGPGTSIGALVDNTIGTNSDGGNAFNLRDTSGNSVSLDHVHKVQVGGETSQELNDHKHTFTTNDGDAPISNTPLSITTATPSMVVTFYMKL